jgi:hypothetical protein
MPPDEPTHPRPPGLWSFPGRYWPNPATTTTINTPTGRPTVTRPPSGSQDASDNSPQVASCDLGIDGNPVAQCPECDAYFPVPANAGGALVDCLDCPTRLVLDMPMAPQMLDNGTTKPASITVEGMTSNGR